MMTDKFITAYFNKIRDVYTNGRKLSFPDRVEALPDWIEYIAADADGEVYGYDYPPAINEEGGCHVIHKVDMKSLWLFSIDIDKNTNWKDTSVRMSCIINTLKESEKVKKMTKQSKTKSEYKSILKFNLWQPGETTLVANIVETKNISRNMYLITDNHNSFMEFFAGLHVIDNWKGKPKDMIKAFSSSKERNEYVIKLIKNINDSFKKTYLEAIEDDIGEEVCIETPYDMKGILRAVTTDGRYVVEADELRIVDKAWVKQENKVRHYATGYVDGRVLHEFKILY